MFLSCNVSTVYSSGSCSDFSVHDPTESIPTRLLTVMVVDLSSLAIADASVSQVLAGATELMHQDEIVFSLVNGSPQ